MPGIYSKRTSQQLAATDALNPSVHAVISIYKGALDQAAQADEASERGEWLGILHGSTVAIKDVIDTKGQRTTMGSQFFADHIPESDAEVVTRLKNAGAIPISKTNLAEFAMGATSQNPHFGFVANAWDHARVAGGSSGGSAVAVATGMADLALGTDTGGSVLVPSALNGIVGLRPSRGRVSNRGVFPVSRNFDTVGPMARTAAGVHRLLAAIEGRDIADPYSSAAEWPMAFDDASVASVKGLRIGVPENYFIADERAISHCVAGALECFADLGAIIVPITLEGAEEAPANMARQMFADFVSEHSARVQNQMELFGEDLQHRLRLGLESEGRSYSEARRWTQEWRHMLSKTFRDIDFILTPTVPITAPLLSTSTTVTTSPVLTRFTHPWCLSEGPTLSLPGGFNPDGMPLAFQMSGKHMDDGRLLAAGMAYQTATDWHERTPAYAGSQPAGQDQSTPTRGNAVEQA